VGLFKKKEPAPPQPPEFAVMDAREWAGFNEVVRDVMKRTRIDVERYEPGAVVIRDRGTFGLLNVAQLCHVNPRGEWPAIVANHFANVLAAGEEVWAPDLLRVRLFPDDYFGPEALAATVTRPYAESVVAGLVIDLPTRVQTVAPEQLAEAELDPDAAWDLAWRHTRASERPEHYEVANINGAPVHSMLGDSFFTASLVQFLPDLVGAIGPNGAVVSIPRRHTILAHVVENLAAANAVQGMLPLTRSLYAEGPGSISAHLYWWRDGDLRWLPSMVSETAIEFYPPDDFVDMLNGLDPA
jgi:hypothetical protein